MYASTEPKRIGRGGNHGGGLFLSRHATSVLQSASAGGSAAGHLHLMLNSSPRATQLKEFQKTAGNYPQGGELAQLQARMNRCFGRVHDGPVQRKCGPEMENDLVAGSQRNFETSQLRKAQAMFDSSPRVSAHHHRAPLQLKIEDDLQTLGLEGVLDFLRKSDRAQALIKRANDAKVAVVKGGWGGAQTAREVRSGRISVSIPPGNDLEAAQSLIFELHNALRQDRFDLLSRQATTGEIPDEDEYARKKAQIEIEGMVGTAKIADEIRRKGIQVPVDKFYTSIFLKYVKYAKTNPFASLQEFTQQQADEVLDIPHAQGSHRKVYTEQFRAGQNSANRGARAENEKQRRLASQVRGASKLIGREQAVEKLWREETTRVPALLDYLTRQSDSAPNAELRADLVRGLAPVLNAAINRGDDVEPFIMQHTGLMAALHSWVEANDEGQYRNLSQVLSLALGHYDNHPEHLRISNLYQVKTEQ